MHKTLIASLVVLGLCAGLARAAEPTLKVGDPAPALATGKWIKGEPVKEFEKGKIYVVEFWATWCGPCRVSIPHLTELQKQYKDIVFIGQDCAERNQDGVVPFVEKMGDKMDYRVAMDDVSDGPRGKMMTTWMMAAGQSGIPTAFVVDKEGKIAWIGHPMQMDDVLKQITAGTFDPKKAAAERELEQAMIKKVVQAMQAKDPEKTLAAVEEAAKASPKLANQLMTLKLQLLVQTKQFKPATALAREMAETHKDQAQALNEIAWTMVNPETKFEDPDLELAEKAANRANELTGGNNPAVLDTLSHVMFVKGQVDKAIEIETKALEKTDNEQMKQHLQKVLDEYKAKKDAK